MPQCQGVRQPRLHTIPEHPDDFNTSTPTISIPVLVLKSSGCSGIVCRHVCVSVQSAQFQCNVRCRKSWAWPVQCPANVKPAGWLRVLGCYHTVNMRHSNAESKYNFPPSIDCACANARVCKCSACRTALLGLGSCSRMATPTFTVQCCVRGYRRTSARYGSQISRDLQPARDYASGFGRHFDGAQTKG